MYKLDWLKLFALLLLFLLPVPPQAYSQEVALRGRVLDARTGEPLTGASVRVEGTGNGAAADLDGNYVIRNLKAGTYTLVASYVAYRSGTKTGITVGGDDTVTVDFLLNAEARGLPELEVVARADRENENVLLTERRLALTVTQAVGARELSRKGIGDARTAVAQMSGISHQEGVRNVFVRGLGDRYNVTLLNGFVIPSEDPEYKNIALEFFGTGVIQHISVKKVFSGRDCADAGGAGINIVSRELSGDRALSLNLSTGLNTVAADGDSFLRQKGAGYFGFADTSRPAGDRYDFPGSLNPQRISVPPNHSYGISGGKTFRPADGNTPLSLFAAASHSTGYSRTKEFIRNTTADGTVWQDQTGDRFSQEISRLLLANAHLRPGRRHSLQYSFMLIHACSRYVGEYRGYDSERYQGSPSGTGFSRRQQTNDNLLTVNQLLSGWELTGRIKLHAGISFSTVKGAEPDRRENSLTLKENDRYDLTGSNRNKRFFSDLRSGDVNVKASLLIRLKDSSGAAGPELTTGYDGRFADEEFEAIEYNFSPQGMSSLSVGDPDMDELFEQNLADGLLRMTVGDPNSYRVAKQIHAGFAELSGPLSGSLAGNVGVRLEQVDLTVRHHVSHVAPGAGSIRRSNLLPSLNLKYDPDGKNSIRLGVSKTYTLPQSKEISPFQYVNISFADQGNPALKPSDNCNADLKWDFCMTPGELLSVAIFCKYILNPIGRVDQGNSAGLLTYDNISDHALVRGVELELRKNLFIRSVAATGQTGRISAGLNLSCTRTSLRLKVLNTPVRHTQLEGASPLLVSADLSCHYAKGERSHHVTLMLNSFSDRIHTLGARGFGDIIEEGIPTLDVAASCTLHSHLSLKLKAANLLNLPHKLSRKSGAGNEKVTLEKFRKGQDISLEISYRL
ncbi:MAG: TonB-dependent receptor [Proteiniphilum sp.]|jgi:hypothetical protein|nr:TonB-dependent receptor [Proteiniphilum sp.]